MIIKEQVTRREEVKRIILDAHKYANSYEGYSFSGDFIQYLIELLDDPSKLDEKITIENVNIGGFDFKRKGV